MTSAGPRSSVLALNSGSSSLKFGMYRIESSIPKTLLWARPSSIGDRLEGEFWMKMRKLQAARFPKPREFRNPEGSGRTHRTFLADRDEIQPTAVGHRVVHGGPNLRRHCRSTNDAAPARSCNRLRATAQSSGLSVIRFAQEALPAGCRRWPASIRHFTLGCQMSRDLGRSP